MGFAIVFYDEKDRRKQIFLTIFILLS